MARGEVTPLRSIERRLPEMGRIRIGGEKPKSGKGAGAKLETFRLTTDKVEALRIAAERFGGEIKPWTGSMAPGQYQLITQTKVLPIALPPEPISGPLYELWSGGGCQRRCDGEMAQIPQHTADGADLVEVPCLCQRKGKLECSPKLRLSVLLRGLPFAGVWRYETSSWASVRELPGMVELVQALDERAIATRAELHLEQRSGKVWDPRKGKIITTHFNVVTVGLAEDIESLMGGSARLGALAPAPSPGPAAPALPVADGDPQAADDHGGEDEVAEDQTEQEHPFDHGPDAEEIIEAELVDDEPAPENQPSRRRSPHPAQTRLVLQCAELAKHVGYDDAAIRHALALGASDGRTSSSAELTDAERSQAIDVADKLLTGELEFRRIEAGRLILGRRDQG
jgi:hypothetical protein